MNKVGSFGVSADLEMIRLGVCLAHHSDKGEIVTQNTVTQLLARWRSGEDEAYVLLIDQIYDELHRIASREFRGERSGHTLQATGLLHEAILHLGDLSTVPWQDRGHFYAVATRLMRRILLDYARKLGRLKRGGDLKRVTFEEADRLTPGGFGGKPADPDIEALDAALDALEDWDSRKARIVELRFFVGLTAEEIGKCLDISVATVNREWRRARAWLFHEMTGALADG